MGGGTFVSFFVSVCILFVVLNVLFCFGLGCLVYVLWDIVCAFFIFFTLLNPGSTLLTVTREIRVQILAGDIFFFTTFFFVERKYNFIFP